MSSTWSCIWVSHDGVPLLMLKRCWLGYVEEYKAIYEPIEDEL